MTSSSTGAGIAHAHRMALSLILAAQRHTDAIAAAKHHAMTEAAAAARASALSTPSPRRSKKCTIM